MVGSNEELKKLVQLLCIASRMVLMHANDLLDWRIIENGSFVASMTSGSISGAITEMVDLVNSTLTNRNLSVI